MPPLPSLAGTQGCIPCDSIAAAAATEHDGPCSFPPALAPVAALAVAGEPRGLSWRLAVPGGAGRVRASLERGAFFLTPVAPGGFARAHDSEWAPVAALAAVEAPRAFPMRSMAPGGCARAHDDEWPPVAALAAVRARGSSHFTLVYPPTTGRTTLEGKRVNTEGVEEAPRADGGEDAITRPPLVLVPLRPAAPGGFARGHGGVL